MKPIIHLVAVVIFTLGFLSQANSGEVKKNTKPTKANYIFVAEINPEGKDALNEYLEKSHVLLVKAGAKIIAKHGIKEQIFGTVPSSIIGMGEFPDEKSLRAHFDSKEYKTLLAVRGKAFKTLQLYITVQ